MPSVQLILFASSLRVNNTLQIHCFHAINSTSIKDSVNTNLSISLIQFQWLTFTSSIILSNSKESIHLSSDSISSIITAKSTIYFPFIPPIKKLHWFHHEGRSHIWWTNIIYDCYTWNMMDIHHIRLTSIIHDMHTS